jgi:hypothetical protein
VRMRRKAPLPRQLGSTFGVKAARAAGVTRGRLRAADLRTSFRGARSVEDGASADEARPDTFDAMRQRIVQRCRDYLPVAPVEFRFSGVTAAVLYGVPLPARVIRSTTLEVAVPLRAQRPRRAGITGRRLATLPDPVLRQGMPVVPAEQLWLQLASVLSLDELIIAGDYLVKRKHADTSMERLHAQVAIAKGAHGTKRAREALPHIRPGVDSPKETELRLLLVRAGLPEPRVGYEVRDAHGYFIGVPDLAYPKERIAIDYEGEVHRLDEQTFLDDIERRERFEDADWRYIRVSKDHLRSPGTLLQRVARYLRLRAPGT